MAKEFARAFYNSKVWKECRKAYIAGVNGLCERCLDGGKYTPGYILHHKTLLNANNITDPTITLNHDKLLYVCKDCHEACHGNFSEPLRDGLTFTDDGDIVEL
jgi:hypothetical protein